MNSLQNSDSFQYFNSNLLEFWSLEGFTSFVNKDRRIPGRGSTTKKKFTDLLVDISQLPDDSNHQVKSKAKKLLEVVISSKRKKTIYMQTKLLFC
jgi:hypothetical protein